MRDIAVSIGDLNGVGVEIALKSHKRVREFCNPIYFIDDGMLNQALNLLKIKRPLNFHTVSKVSSNFEIEPSKLSKDSGLYSFNSFLRAIDSAKNREVDAVVTLPINKEAWSKADIKYKGHTDCLRDIFKQNAIMMLGCEEMFVALYSEHIPLKDVPKYIEKESLVEFMLNLLAEIKEDNIAVLGLNPHAGDNGVLGAEESIIQEAIDEVNSRLKQRVFKGVFVPDIAFTKSMRERFKYFLAMYHDQGLIPLKALYFDESINISLNLPIIRTSVDHGSAFDIAYRGVAKNLSYINAIKEAIKLANIRFAKE